MAPALRVEFEFIWQNEIRAVCPVFHFALKLSPKAKSSFSSRD
jgi:hypothetical protein